MRSPLLTAARRLSTPRATALGVLASVAFVTVVAFLVSASLAGGGQPATSQASTAGRPTPSPRGAPPSAAAGAPASPTPSSAPPPTSVSGSMTKSGPSPAPAAPAPVPQLVVETFQDGTDGWIQEWGPITLAAGTDPAIDGGSLLLTASGDHPAAVGTSSGVTQLKTGDTVTYHVWSSGQQGTVQPWVADDDNNLAFAGPGTTSLPSASGWFTLTWTVPATSSVEAIGLQVVNPGSRRSTLRLALGDVSWPQQ